MRCRAAVTRLRVADRWVRASDHEDAAQKARAEFHRPYRYLGSWKTVSAGVEVVEEEPVDGITPGHVADSGPRLLPVKVAAQELGVSRKRDVVVNSGDIEQVDLEMGGPH